MSDRCGKFTCQKCFLPIFSSQMSGHQILISILCRSIVEILYCNYSSVCPVGTTGNLIFYLILLIWFQHQSLLLTKVESDCFSATNVDHRSFTWTPLYYLQFFTCQHHPDSTGKRYYSPMDATEGFEQSSHPTIPEQNLIRFRSGLNVRISQFLPG